MKKSLIIALWAIAILWAVYILNIIVFFADFKALGIRPREGWGIIGIPLSPFLHGSWGHLISNSIPLFILTFVLAQFYKKLWIQVTVFSVLVGGFAVWLLAQKNTVHIGASGVIFSYIGFIVFSGVFRRSAKSIIIGIIILLLYGGTLIFGVLPKQPGISWQGHLFGAIAGIIAAYIYKDKYKADDKFKS
jgi:membrane associated rhomboid family serine protease